MKVSFNPSINTGYKYPTQTFGSGMQSQNVYTPSSVRYVKIKKTVYRLSLLAMALGILYFGFKKGAKNMRAKAKEKDLKKMADSIIPEVDQRVLDIVRKAQ